MGASGSKTSTRRARAVVTPVDNSFAPALHSAPKIPKLEDYEAQKPPISTSDVFDKTTLSAGDPALSSGLDVPSTGSDERHSSVAESLASIANRNVEHDGAHETVIPSKLLEKRASLVSSKLSNRSSALSSSASTQMSEKSSLMLDPTSGDRIEPPSTKSFSLTITLTPDIVEPKDEQPPVQILQEVEIEHQNQPSHPVFMHRSSTVSSRMQSTAGRERYNMNCVSYDIKSMNSIQSVPVSIATTESGMSDDLQKFRASIAANAITQGRRASITRRPSLGAHLTLPTIPQNHPLMRSKSGSLDELKLSRQNINSLTTSSANGPSAAALPHLDLAKPIQMNDKLALAAFGIGVADKESILHYTESAAVPLASATEITGNQNTDISMITSLLGAGDVKQWERRRMSLPTEIAISDTFSSNSSKVHISIESETSRSKSFSEAAGQVPGASRDPSPNSTREKDINNLGTPVAVPKSILKSSNSTLRAQSAVPNSSSPSGSNSSFLNNAPARTNSITGVPLPPQQHHTKRKSVTQSILAGLLPDGSASMSASDSMPVDMEAFTKEHNVFVKWVESHGIGAIYKQGEVIIKKKDATRDVFYVVSGSVEVISSNRDKRYAHIGAGQFFGELGLLYDTSRTATVRALETVKCRILTHEEVEAIVESFPMVGRRLLSIAATRMSEVATATNKSHLNSCRWTKNSDSRTSSKQLSNNANNGGHETESRNLFRDHIVETITMQLGAMHKNGWMDQSTHEQILALLQKSGSGPHDISGAASRASDTPSRSKQAAI